MPQRALSQHRPWLLVAVIAAIAYYVLKDGALGGLWVMLIKGSAAGALALYALMRGPGGDAKILTLFLGISALGDMGVNYQLELGGAIFFVAHLAALTLFLKNPRPATSGSQKGLAAVLLLGTPLISWLISGDWQVAVYSVALGGMAASAWMSRFPRYRVGIGAVLFVISDWLIFAQMGVLEGSALPEWLVWPFYFAAQFLIATGVVQTLRGEHPETAKMPT
ncbi:MAG: lysoplasmalogenase family protein [Marinomonas sp.]